VEFDGKDIKGIIDDISSVKEAVARIEERQKHPSAACSIHGEQLRSLNERVDSIETQQGKQNLIAVTLGAIGAGIILAIKYLMLKAAT